MLLKGLIYSIPVFLVTAVIFLSLSSDNPEKLILGDWQELEWSYEKADDLPLFYYDLSKIIKHEAEKWVFKDGRKIEFHKDNELVTVADYVIKGRGHILKLTYPNGKEERYDIKELNHNEMILNFDIGMETRGIAKLTFKRKS
ncbi:hypothetical protein [Pararhodonellum marinum]|uniref:hypothetical protein n=1 Tax=Pararhodonellum marinum TaxID=2755358 RepID=UPI00189066DE|nr:hypothetical protein [Pararhodonellum marinum]